MTIDIQKIVETSYKKDIRPTMSLFQHLYIFEKDTAAFNIVALSTTAAKKADANTLLQSLELFVMKANWLQMYDKENAEATLSAFHREEGIFLEAISVFKENEVSCLSVIIESSRDEEKNKAMFNRFRFMVVNKNTFHDKSPDKELLFLKGFNIHV